MTDAQNRSRTLPFLKWAGGKSQLLEQYARFFPKGNFRAYCEPFIGSGAVFFYLREKNLFRTYHLSDINEELINCYRAVRDDVDALIGELKRHKEKHTQNAEDHYYQVRDWDRDPNWSKEPSVLRAARMIYLNKTCYNGLYRVNSQGHFNVPIGRYENPDIANEERLRRASEALQGVELRVCGFQEAVLQAGSDDFVYFDPPYMPVSETANFTSYSKHDFGIEQQDTLANVFADLTIRGCRVMLSNSKTPYITKLYRNLSLKRKPRIKKIEARRAINSKAKKRGEIYEVVILNY